MKIATSRLLLRSWHESDAPELFALACDPAIGPAAGWPPHESVEMSRQAIRTVLAGPESIRHRARMPGGRDPRGYPGGSHRSQRSRCEQVHRE